jgi:superfamily I DNA/RNA helicase
VPIALADTFLSSLITLARGEQKSAAEFVEKFQRNPAQPGISLERITQTRNDNLWSARVTQALRAVVHKEGDLWNLLYVGQHDDAYHWAGRRSVERNPRTGTLQIVVAPETLAESIQQAPLLNALPLFQKYNDDYLLSLGLPESWLPTIRMLATEDQLIQILQNLPEEVAERLLDLSYGNLVTPPQPVPANVPAIEAEDSQRRFYVIEDSEELLRMLSAPMAKWIGFLHPSQKKLVTSRFNGPAKVTGSAGTGKTVVAMHRARYLARQGKNVLLTTYVGTLCDNIRENLKYLCSPDELSRITVDTVHAQALQLVRAAGEKPTIIDDQDIAKLVDQFHWGACPLDARSLQSEWTEVIQAQGIRSWDHYRDANRKGRGQALGAKDRKLVWQVFEQVLQRLTQNHMCDWSALCQRARELVQSGKARTKFNAVIVDEVQDLRPQEIRFLASLARERDNLMLVGDGGQRIYGNKLTLKSLDVDVRGRSFVLRINYRTTAQIRSFADNLLANERDDLDEGEEDSSGTKSLLKGPEPILAGFNSMEDQIEFVTRSISEIIKQGVTPQDIAIFARTNELLIPFEKALKSKRIEYRQLKKESSGPTILGVNLGTMHRAKGLEFKVVFVVDASHDYLPLPVALRTIKDAGDRQDAVEREKHLLYVSITRARDEVFVSWTGKACEFLNKPRTARVVALAKR